MSESASHTAHAHEPPPPVEPKSPMWLPALGAALFISVGLWWAVTPKAPPPPEDETPAATVAAAPTPPPQAVPGQPSAGLRPGVPPGAAGSAHAGAPDNAALQRILERLPKQ